MSSRGQTIGWQYSFSPGTATKKIFLTPSNRWGLFRESDTIGITTSGNSQVRVISLRTGSVVYAGAPTSLRLTRGHYFIETSGDRAQFAVLPNDYAGATFLGSVADNGWIDLSQRIQQIQPAWVRTGVSRWDLVESSAGIFNWSEMDQIVANRQGRKLIAVAASSIPAWVTPSQLVTRYVLFVRALATRYATQLSAIEIWNEPYGAMFYNDPNWRQTLQTIHLQARAAIKAIAPAIQVIGPAWNNPISYDDTADMAAMGLNSSIDGLSWHDYFLSSPPPDQQAQRFGTGPVVPDVLERVAAYREALANPSKPVYVDELGLGARSPLGFVYPADVSKPDPDWQRGMYRGIKYAALYRAAGVNMLLPHVMPLAAPTANEAEAALFGWEVGYRGPHPKTSAFLMSAYWLNNSTMVDYRTLGRRVFLYAWRRPNLTSVVFAWTREGDAVALKSNHGLRTTDIFGSPMTVGSLTEKPIIIHGASADTLGLLATTVAALNETINTAPVFEPPDNQSVLGGQSLQFAITATDPDHEPIKYSVSPMPVGASLDASSGLFRWTPSLTQVGSYTVTFTARDVRGLSRSVATVIYVLSGPNDRLAAYWKLDEGTGSTTVNSLGGLRGSLLNFNFNTYSGWVSGVLGKALLFDGVDDAVALDNSQLNLPNNFTVAAWVKAADAETGGAFFSIRSITGSSGIEFWVRSRSFKVQGRAPAGYVQTHFGSNTLQNNAWYHLVLVYDKSRLRGYVNGVEQEPIGSIDWAGDVVMSLSGSSRIGGCAGFPFKGVVDNLSVFTRTLNADEIMALYSGNRPPILNPIGGKTAAVGQLLTFALSGSDPDNDALAYSVTGLPSGASFNATTRTFSWIPASSQVGTHTISCRVSDGVATDAEAVTITVPTMIVATATIAGPIAHWKFDEGTGWTAADSVGSNHGTLSGINFNTYSGWVDWGPASTDSALCFDGQNDVVLLNSSKLMLTNNFTVTAWVYAKNSDVGGTYFSVRSAYQASGLDLWVRGHSLKVEGKSPMGYLQTWFGASIQDNTWYHLTVIYDRSRVRAFINGVEQAPIGNASWGGSLVMDPNYPSKIGASYGNRFYGAIDEVKVFNRILSSAEVGALYQESDSAPNSGPVMNPIGSKTVTAGQSLSFTISAVDPDGDPLRYWASNLPAGAAFNATTRTFSWTPTTAQIGTYQVSFGVTDGELSTPVAVTITVKSATANQAPSLYPIADKTVRIGTNLSFVISGSDPNGDPVRYWASNLPPGATFNATTRTFSWTPSAGQAGIYRPTFGITDGSLSSPASVTIYVNN